MGGSITVVSEIGKGADFIFFIKSATASYVEPKKPVRSRLRMPKLAGRSGGHDSPRSLRSSFSTDGQDLTFENLEFQQRKREMRVLVVEDNLLSK